MRFSFFEAFIVLAACSPRAPSPAEQLVQQQIENMQQRYQAEAKRIEPFEKQVRRDGQTLSITADNGKTLRFTDNNPCIGYECSLYDFKGMYAEAQFYRLNHIHAEFFIPDYLISRRSGTTTDMVGPLEEKNISPNGQLIVNAVGGDTGPDAAIYLWQIADGELLPLVAHPFESYGYFTAMEWNPESTAVSFSKEGYFTECKSDSRKEDWGTSSVVLQKQPEGWSILESNVQCRRTPS